MPSPFRASVVAQTLGVMNKYDVFDQPSSPATVVDPRAVNDEKNPVFRTHAEGPDKMAAFMAKNKAKSQAQKGYTVMPGGRIVRGGVKPLVAPHLPKQVSLGHDANVNTTSGRHL